MRSFLLLLLMSGCIPGPSGSAPTTDGIEEIPPMPIKVSAVAETTPVEPIPPVEEQVQPESRPLTEESSSGEKQADPPSVETVTPPSVDAGGGSNSKPLVTCYSSQYGVHCPGCIRAKQWYEGLSDKDRAALPFRVRFTSEVPNWVQAVPTFHWNATDKSPYFEGWHGPAHLIQAWENSFVRHATTATEPASVQSACGPGGCVRGKRR